MSDLPHPRWLVTVVPRPEARLRLFCFHHAGGGASLFRAWGAALPRDVEVCAVQLPGREHRFGVTRFRRMGPLVAALTRELAPALDRPFALLGHSMGAQVAFEWARRLRAERGEQPAVLFVSGRRAPHLPTDKPPSWNLPDDAFMERLRELGGTPEEVLAEEGLMALLTPLLRDDFAVIDTHVHEAAAPLSCPIVAMVGREDTEASPQDMAAWREHTTGRFGLQVFPGGHFYLSQDPRRAMELVTEELEEVLRGMGAVRR